MRGLECSAPGRHQFKHNFSIVPGYKVLTLYSGTGSGTGTTIFVSALVFYSRSSGLIINMAEGLTWSEEEETHLSEPPTKSCWCSGTKSECSLRPLLGLVSFKIRMNLHGVSIIRLLEVKEIFSVVK